MPSPDERSVTPVLRHRWTVLAFCETCGKLFYTPTGKFCDNPRCAGWLHHIAR